MDAPRNANNYTPLPASPGATTHSLYADSNVGQRDSGSIFKNASVAVFRPPGPQCDRAWTESRELDS